jgi:predicted amidohydrolase YtcJ
MCTWCTPLMSAFLASRRGSLRAGSALVAAAVAAPATGASAQPAAVPANPMPVPASLPAKADLIIGNGTIVTMDPARPVAEAVAIAGALIIGVGTQAEIEARFAGPATRRLDLAGRTLLPGFIDPHSHIAQFVLTWGTPVLNPPPVGTVRAIPDIIRLLREDIARRNPPAGETIFAMGYDDSLLAEGRHPNRADLDQVSTTHPVIIVHASGHLLAANSAALAAAGITRDSKAPEGGVIRRSPDGEPDGVLEELAGLPMLALIKPLPMDEQLRRFAEVQTYYASLGITTAQDGISMAGDVALMREAARRGQLMLDVVSYPRWDMFNDVIAGRQTLDVEIVPPALAGASGLTRYLPAAAAAPQLSPDARTRVGVYDRGLKFGGIKITGDGSPQGKTAYLTRPYVKPPPGMPASYRGYPTVTQEEADRWFDLAWRYGLQVIMHCNGDAAADVMLASVRRAIGTHGKRDLRPVMIHAQMIREDQVSQMAELGIVPSFFTAHTFYWGDWHIAETVGPDRAAGMSPAASALRLGIPFTNHTDANVVPPDHLMAIWTAVNRVSRSGAVVGPAQRIPVHAALAAVTINAAQQYFEETQKGSITVGKLADLIVLDRNPLDVDPAVIKDIRVQATYKAGKLIWRAP